MNKFIKYAKQLIVLKLVNPFKLLFKHDKDSITGLRSDILLMLIIMCVLSILNIIFLTIWLALYPLIHNHKIKVLRFINKLNKGRF